MNGRVLASVVRKAMVFRMSEAAVIHTIDDDESMRAGARQTSALDPDSTGGAINLTVSSRRAEWASPVFCHRSRSDRRDICGNRQAPARAADHSAQLMESDTCP